MREELRRDLPNGPSRAGPGRPLVDLQRDPAVGLFDGLAHEPGAMACSRCVSWSLDTRQVTGNQHRPGVAQDSWLSGFRCRRYQPPARLGLCRATSRSTAAVAAPGGHRRRLLPAAAVHDVVERAPVGPLDRRERAVHGDAERNQQGAEPVLGIAQQATR
jgi:hypothetical protein